MTVMPRLSSRRMMQKMPAEQCWHTGVTRRLESNMDKVLRIYVYLIAQEGATLEKRIATCEDRIVKVDVFANDSEGAPIDAGFRYQLGRYAADPYGKPL